MQQAGLITNWASYQQNALLFHIHRKTGLVFKITSQAFSRFQFLEVDMKKITSKTRLGKVENPILGKRHENNDKSKGHIKNKATELGFSSDEIKQLLRLYTEK